MTPSTRRSLLGLSLLTGLAVAGICWYLFVSRRPAPRDIDKVGGTILVYEIDSGADAPHSSKLEALPSALQKRLDPDGLHSITARLVDKARVEVRIPHLGEHHDEEIEYAKILIGGAGSLEFRVLANKHDDDEAILAAKRYFRNAADSWEEFLKAVRERYPDAGKILGIGPGDLVWLEDLIVNRTRKDRADVRQFLRTKFKPNEQLQELLLRAKAGLPPPAPVGPSGKTFKISLNDGDHRVSYSWIELSRNELDLLRLDDGVTDGVPWKAAENARNQGLAVESSQIAGDRRGGPGWETLFYSRKILNQEARLADEDRSKKFEYFVLTRDPEPGREVTGEHFSKAESSREIEPGWKTNNTTINFRLTPEGSKRLSELTSANRPPDEGNGERCLAVVFRGQVLLAPSIKWTIREAGVIQGRFTDEETNALTLALNSGAPLPVRLKPQPVSEKQVPAAEKP